MKTLQEHFDDLDRMVDTGASKPAIREQVAFLWTQVRALLADYSSLAEAHSTLHKAKAQSDADAAALAKKYENPASPQYEGPMPWADPIEPA